MKMKRRRPARNPRARSRGPSVFQVLISRLLSSTNRLPSSGTGRAPAPRAGPRPTRLRPKRPVLRKPAIPRVGMPRARSGARTARPRARRRRRAPRLLKVGTETGSPRRHLTRPARRRPPRRAAGTRLASLRVPERRRASPPPIGETHLPQNRRPRPLAGTGPGDEDSQAHARRPAPGADARSQLTLGEPARHRAVAAVLAVAAGL